MKPRTLIIGGILLVVLFFAAINWGTFNEPQTISFLFGEVQAPLGILLLAAIGLLALVFLFFLARIETAALLDRSRTSKELEKARKLADDSEESRFRELSNRLDVALEELHQKLDRLLEPDGATGGDRRHADRTPLVEPPPDPEPAATEREP